MTGSLALPSIDVLKDHARRLRARLARAGNPIGHGKALELPADQWGYKDWNTLHAAVDNRPPPRPAGFGAPVGGHYLGRAFAGQATGLQVLSPPGRFRITLQFDEPVDVVAFESFSAFRSPRLQDAGASSSNLGDHRLVEIRQVRLQVRQEGGDR